MRAFLALALAIGFHLGTERLAVFFLSYDRTTSTSRSPGGSWEVETRSVDPWAYGSEGIHVIARPLDKNWKDPASGEFEALSFDLHNDGASLGPWNLVGRWQNDSVLFLYCHGQEQADTVYRVDLASRRSKWRWDGFWNDLGALAFFALLWVLLEAALVVFRTPVAVEREPSP